MAMERPESSELDAIFATAAEIRATEARLKELKVQGSAQAQALANIPDKKIRLAAAIYAYWYAPEINASDLSFGATGKAHPSALLKLVGPVSVGVPCERCGQDMPITSRANMKAVLDGVQSGPRWAEGYSVICAPCQEAVMAARDVEREREEKARAKRSRELAAMPYPAYLETEEWRTQRDHYLWFLLESHQSDLGCETCGAGGDRGIFHKSLDHLGFGDEIIVLCDPCASALLGAGKLAGPPGEGNRLRASTESRILAAHGARYDYAVGD